MIEWIDILLSDIGSQFLNPKKRLFIGYLFSAFCIASLWLVIFQRKSLVASVKTVLSPRVWFSRSSRMDALCFLINRGVFMVLRPALVTQLAIATLIYQGLHYQSMIAVGAFETAPYWLAASLFTLILFVLDDFSRFIVHMMLHRIPALWEFHKFHHSAEHLTPLTVTRAHPVEGLLFTLRSAITQGVVIAAFVFLFGGTVDLITIYGINVFIVVFHGLGSNLRHSHIRIRYPAMVEKWLISPAQHQLHHSDLPQHFDKNFGVALSLWDRIFGSFHLSTGDDLRFGIGRETAEYTRSVWSMYLSPFKKLWVRYGRAKSTRVSHQSRQSRQA